MGPRGPAISLDVDCKPWKYILLVICSFFHMKNPDIWDQPFKFHARTLNTMAYKKPLQMNSPWNLPNTQPWNNTHKIWVRIKLNQIQYPTTKP